MWHNATSDTVILDAELRTAENACEAMRSKNSIIKQTKTEQQYEEANKGYLWEDANLWDTQRTHPWPEGAASDCEWRAGAWAEEAASSSTQSYSTHWIQKKSGQLPNLQEHKQIHHANNECVQTYGMSESKETSADIAWTQWSHLRTRTRGQHVKQSSRALQLLHHHSKCENRSRINSALLEVAFRVTMSKTDATFVNKWVRIVTNQGIQ